MWGEKWNPFIGAIIAISQRKLISSHLIAIMLHATATSTFLWAWEIVFELISIKR